VPVRRPGLDGCAAGRTPTSTPLAPVDIHHDDRICPSAG